MTLEARPRAREGLLASDHSKRGRRFVILVDPETHAATLLEPWEHAILVLCDGSRTPAVLVDLLAPEVEGTPIDLEVVRRCLKFFERQGLITKVGLRASDAPPPGPVTLTELQRAYAEWHKSPADQEPDTGVPPPIPRTSPKIAAGLDPTVSARQAGSSKSMLTGVHSLLDAAAAVEEDTGDLEETDPPMPDLMAALDDAMAEASQVERTERARKEKRRAGVEVAEAESRPRTSGVFAPPAGGVVVAPELAERGLERSSERAPEAPPVTRVGPPASRPPAPVEASKSPEELRAPAAVGNKPAAIPGVPKRPSKGPTSGRPAPAAPSARPSAPSPNARPAPPPQPQPAPSRSADEQTVSPELAAVVARGGGSTEPTMRLADLLGTDATEPATILLRPEPPGGVRLRAEDDLGGDTQRLGKTKDVETQLGSLVKKR